MAHEDPRSQALANKRRCRGLEVTIDTVQQVDCALTSTLAADDTTLQNRRCRYRRKLERGHEHTCVTKTVTEAIDDLDELGELDYR